MYTIQYEPGGGDRLVLTFRQDEPVSSQVSSLALPLL